MEWKAVGRTISTSHFGQNALLKGGGIFFFPKDREEVKSAGSRSLVKALEPRSNTSSRKTLQKHGNSQGCYLREYSATLSDFKKIIQLYSFIPSFLLSSNNSKTEKFYNFI